MKPPFRLLLLVPLTLAFSSCALPQKLSSSGPYDAPAYRPKNPSAVQVKVSLQNRMVYVMEGDRPLLVTPTAIGKPGNETPKGHFRAFNKIAQKRSNTYGFWVNGTSIVPGKSGQSPGGGGWRYVGFPMPYWVEFQPAYGFHEGSVWPTPRTHGCLRLHKNVAPKFYHLVNEGTPIYIADSLPEDATIGKNVRRPADFNDPDPPAAITVSSRAFPPPPANLFAD